MRSCIITIIIMLLGVGCFAQEDPGYNQDTIWLKSGEIIPCIIDRYDAETEVYHILYIDNNGDPVHKLYNKLFVERTNRDRSTQKPAVYKIDLKDGTRLTGVIKSETDSTVLIELKDMGDLLVDRDKIDKMVSLSASSEIIKAFWFKNPNATRYLFAPTAIPLRKGEGYYQNIYIVGNMVNYGVLNNLSIGGGFDFISMFTSFSGGWSPILNFNAKAGFKISENFHAGAGAIYMTQVNEFSAGIPYGVGTFGSYNSNLTLGLGWGFVDGTFEEKPFIMLGGMARCSEKVWFVSENWLMPVDGNSYYLVVSYGVRFSGKRMSVDLAFINSKDIFDEIIIGIPYVDFVIKFGK